VGYVTIADEIKEDAKASLESLKSEGIKSLMMLSGDKNSITQKVAAQLGIEKAKGGLLPEDKLNEVERIKQDKQKKVAFIGDGINDAPNRPTVENQHRHSNIKIHSKNYLAKHISRLWCQDYCIDLRGRWVGHNVGSSICRCGSSTIGYFKCS